MPVRVHQPTSVVQAKEWLAASPAPFDGASQRRYRAQEHLDRVFASGRRRPDLVWATFAEDGTVLATVAGLEMGPALFLDHWGACTPQDLEPVLAAATAKARERLDSSFVVFSPADQGYTHPAIAPWVAVAERAGWALLAERIHYEFPAVPGLGSGVPLDLDIRPLSGPDDERLPRIIRAILHGSQDAHEVELIAKCGIETAVTETVAYFLESDPWETLHLAYSPDGDLVGLASWRIAPGGRGFLSYTGIAAEARGRGYGRQLAAHISRELLAGGATTLVSDTDRPNAPMVHIFADLGWQQTETRIDMTLP